MFEIVRAYNDDTLKEYGVTKKDISEYADYEMGMKIKNWFDNNPDEEILTFEAEI